jgi:hypothetical protein
MTRDHIRFPPAALDPQTAALIQVAAAMAIGDVDGLMLWLAVAFRVQVPKDWIGSLLRQCCVTAGYKPYAQARRVVWTAFSRTWGRKLVEGFSDDELEEAFNQRAAFDALMEKPARERAFSRLQLRLHPLHCDLGAKRAALCKAALVGVAVTSRGFRARLREARLAGATRTELMALVGRLQALVPAERTRDLYAAVRGTRSRNDRARSATPPSHPPERRPAPPKPVVDRQVRTIRTGGVVVDESRRSTRGPSLAPPTHAPQAATPQPEVTPPKASGLPGARSVHTTPPPTIDAFQDDLQFFAQVGEALLPGWRQHLRRIFDPKRPAFDVVVTGTPESGATMMARVALAYVLCRVLWVPDPLRVYKLLPGSVLRFSLLSSTRDRARRTLYRPLRAELERSPFFVDHLSPRSGRVRRPIAFKEPYLDVTASGFDDPSIHGDLFAALIDLPVAQHHSGADDAVRDLYWSVRRCIVSRFMDGGQMPGLLIVSASSGSAPGFLTSHVKEIQGLEGGYVASLP